MNGQAEKYTNFVKVLRILSTVLIIALLFVVLLQTASRYVIHVAPMWVEEVPGYLLVWITAVGAVLSTRDDSNARMDLFQDMLPPPRRRIVRTFTATASVGALAVLAVYGLQSAIVAHRAQSITLGIPLSIVQIAIPIMAIICIGFIVRSTISEWRPSSPAEQPNGWLPR